MKRRLVMPVLVLVALTGCGGSSHKTATPSPTPTLVDTTAAKADVTLAWETFFNSKGTVAAHAAVLQNGSAFTTELTKLAKLPSAKDLSAKVISVVVLGPSAAVTYNLVGKGGVKLLTGATGTAVQEQGVWKVSTRTYCALVYLQDSTAKLPGCA